MISQRRRHGFSRSAWLKVGLVVAALLALYLPVVYLAERQAEQRLEDLRESRPEAYLAQVRGHESFTAYMADYAEIEGFDTWNDQVPSFLLGRWALYRQRQDAGAHFQPAQCADAVEFEDGRFKRLRTDASDATWTAHYRIAAPDVLLDLGDGQTMKVHVAGLERRIHYIRLTPPGTRAPRYAYRCP